VGEQNQSLTINITNASGLGIYDYSDPAAPKSVGGVNGFGTASEFDVFVRNGYAYSVGAFGLHVVDVSNPAKPNWIATFSAVNGRRVWVLGNFAYVIDHIGILHVFDVSNPARPLRVAGNSNVNTASGAQSWLARYGICAAADTLYLVSNNSFVISDVFRYSPAALQLTALAPSLPGSSRLRIAGPSGMNAHLERSTDLRTWEQVHSLILTDLPKDFIDAGSSSGYSFYRLTAP
jgi:hypothetical protein